MIGDGAASVSGHNAAYALELHQRESVSVDRDEIKTAFYACPPVNGLRGKGLNFLIDCPGKVSSHL